MEEEALGWGGGPAAGRERAARILGISSTGMRPRPMSSMVPTRLRTMVEKAAAADA